MRILKNRRGMTLIEAVFASSLFSLAAILALSTIVDMIRMIDHQKAVLAIDEQGNRALSRVTEAVKMAVLPVRVSYTTNESFRADSRNVFADIDSIQHGFGGSRGQDWRDRLQAGMDSIAFVAPIDAQVVGDVLDDNNNLQIGYERAGRSYMSATASGTPGDGTGFHVRSGSELVNVLAAIDPSKFDADAFAGIRAPTVSDVLDLIDTGVPTPSVTTFMAVRFVPVVDEYGDPILVTEANVFRGNVDIDLDGDGTFNGVFQIGRLQLYYSGGDLPCVEVTGSGSSAVRTLRTMNDVPPLALDLTGDIVLRHNDSNDRVPIFRLVSFSRDYLSNSSDYAGLLEEGNSDDAAVKALNIRLLMLDNFGIENGRLMVSNHLTSLSARWFSTTVYLKNMDRN